MFSGGTAYAQASPRSPLNDLGVSELRSELTSRYDAAVTMTQDSNVVRSDDSKFLWASETKVWCGIAIGYTKTSTKDEESINKCDAFYARMTATPPGSAARLCAAASATTDLHGIACNRSLLRLEHRYACGRG